MNRPTSTTCWKQGQRRRNNKCTMEMMHDDDTTGTHAMSRQMPTCVLPSCSSPHYSCLCLVRFAIILGALQLHLESLHTNLEAIHGLYGALRSQGIVITHKTKAFAKICLFINKNSG